MLGLQIDEPTFPLDVSSLDPVSFVSPSLSAHDTQSAYCNQKGVAFNGWRGLGSNQYAAPSTEYTGFSLFDTTGNGDLNSICKLPSSRTQNEGWCLDCVSEVEEKRGHSDSLCRSKPEKGVMDAGFQGPSMKQEDGGGSKEYMGECGEAFLASLMRTMGHDVHFVGDVQASKMRRENALLRFLPSNNEEYAMDVSSCDEFRMYEFKVRRCMKGRSHDWTECPFAHPGEKARRRDPRRFHYSGTACPDFRRGNCKRGDACELSHGVFECWLHPARYRTQLCKDGKSCKRRVCFFAHSPSQLRLVSPEHVPRSGSSFKSPFSNNFSDSSYKHPQYALSPSKLAFSDTYGAEGFLDDFSPRSMHSFPDDRILDAFRTITGDCHILDSSQRHSNNFESSDPKKCYGSNGWSVDGKGEKSNLEIIHAGNSHNYLPLFDDGNFACHVHTDSYSHDPPMVGMPVDGFSNHLAFKNNQAHVNLRTQLALASLSSKFEQIMSPTSTLVRHVFSPPALSPPLSPSDSPPMSPSMVFPSCNATSRKMAALYGHASSRDALSTATDVNNSRANGNSPSNTSLLANLAQSNGAAMFANTCGPSPLSTFSVGDHTNHGDTITAVQPMSTKHVDKDAGLEPGIEDEAHVFPAYQRLRNKRPALPLNGIPVPESRWEADQGSYWVAPIQRIESGQGLRAKIYGKLGKEEVADAENPDFGWVNDLVT